MDIGTRVTTRPRFARRVLAVAVAVSVITVVFWFNYHFRDEPVEYTDDLEHFKYGSIGSEPGGSVLHPEGGLLPPYRVFQALPRICPEMLPGGYQSIGLVYEEGHDLPIGVSKRRRLGFDMLGVNCALCHVGTVADPASERPRIVPGMPAVRTDVQRLMKFSVDCVLDQRFNAANVIKEIRKEGGPVGLVDMLLYRRMVTHLRTEVESLKHKTGFLIYEVPASGPGRLDTFNPLKGLELGWALDERGRERRDELIGTVDFPHLWNLSARDGRGLHWDGNLDSVDETIRSAVLGVGAKPRTLDREALDRVTRYLMRLSPPSYPYAIDRDLARTGAAFFQDHCESCHERRAGAVTAIQEVGTDPHRLNAFTAEVAVKLPQALRERYRAPLFTFTRFRKTDGYLNVPLDGLWTRAPYLHNGSVPSLRALLEPPARRPRFFLRGSEVVDPENVGFMALPPSEGARFSPTVGPCPRSGSHDWEPPAPLRQLMHGKGRELFLFDTSCPGNDNAGHLWGTNLSPKQKDALLEFLKTL